MIGYKIRALMNITGIPSNTIYEALNCLNVVFYRKVKNNTFKADELIKIANATDTTLAFIDKEGKPVVTFDMDDIKKDT